MQLQFDYKTVIVKQSASALHVHTARFAETDLRWIDCLFIYFFCLNIFYCLNNLQYGWATSSTNISYSPSLIPVYTNRQQGSIFNCK